MLKLPLQTRTCIQDFSYSLDPICVYSWLSHCNFSNMWQLWTNNGKPWKKFASWQATWKLPLTMSTRLLQGCHNNVTMLWQPCNNLFDIVSGDVIWVCQDPGPQSHPITLRVSLHTCFLRPEVCHGIISTSPNFTPSAKLFIKKIRALLNMNILSDDIKWGKEGLRPRLGAWANMRMDSSMESWCNLFRGGRMNFITGSLGLNLPLPSNTKLLIWKFAYMKSKCSHKA